MNLWQQYINIIYAPEVEINYLKILKENGLYSSDPSEAAGNLSRTDEVSFHAKMRQEDIEKRLQTLFARDDEQELEKEKSKVARDIDEPYMSVNEDLTSDTPLTSEVEDSEMKR